MKAEEHAFYDASLQRAAERAHGHLVEENACYAVYFDGESVFVQTFEAAKPKNATLVCIAQAWDPHTVQLRFTGARSEWRSFR